jgi:hypothetical protein
MTAPTEVHDGVDEAPGSGLSRRGFLAAANALMLIGLLDACTGGHTGGHGAGAANTADDDLLATLRQAVQASPDYLQRRAIEAVASKNVETIVAFVRDQISVLPSWSKGGDPVLSRRWGSRVTLRGGSGTLRDRADLLVALLTAAGFTASVFTADRPASIDLAALYQVRGADFVPDAGLLAKAAKLEPSSTPSPAPSTTAGADLSVAAADALAAALPVALQQATVRSDLLPATVPVVQVGSAGALQYAFALGDLPVTTTAPAGLSSANSGYSTPQVTVTVSGFANPAPGSATPRGALVTLVSGAWPAEQIFGRQVLLNFVPPSGAIGFLTGAPEQQSVRIPFLRVQTELPGFAAPPIPTAVPSSSSSSPSSSPSAITAPPLPAPVAGDAITLQGDVLKNTTATGSPALPTTGVFAGPLGPTLVLSAAQRAAAINQVASVGVQANPAGYPDISLEVAVLDSSGASVDGLDGSALTVKEDGVAVPFLVMANSPGPSRPRVLVAYDASGSVAETWSSPAAKARFEQDLTATLVATAGQAPFDVQVLGLGQAVAPAADAWTPPTTSSVLTALHNADDSSTMWGTLSGTATDQAAVAIIMVSDFQSGDDPSQIPSDQRRVAASGIPVFCLPIGKPDNAVIATVVALSGGARLDPTAPGTASALGALIKPLVAARASSSYRIRYTASTTGPAQRTVTVGVTGRATPLGSATYTVPTNPPGPPSFCGLYVEISVADYDSGIRHLAGLPTRYGQPVGDVGDPAAAAETRAALYGLTTIAIEPGTVRTAALVDDVLASAESIQPLSALPATTTPQRLIDTASKKGVQRVPSQLAVMLQPPPAQTSPTAVPTMRVAILHERQTGTGLEQHMDLAPGVNAIEPIGPDPHAAFLATLALSARAAALEAVAFDTSAFSQLVGKPLATLAQGDSAASEAFLQTVPAAQQPSWQTVLDEYAYFHVLAPTGGAVPALWVIDPATGAATAVLLDGSGGALAVYASCDPLSQNEKILLVVNTLLTLASLACLFPINVYFCLGATTLGIFFTVYGILADGAIGLTGVPGTLVGLNVPGSAGRFIPKTGFGGVIGAIVILASYLPTIDRVIC